MLSGLVLGDSCTAPLGVMLIHRKMKEPRSRSFMVRYNWNALRGLEENDALRYFEYRLYRYNQSSFAVRERVLFPRGLWDYWFLGEVTSSSHKEIIVPQTPTYKHFWYDPFGKQGNCLDTKYSRKLSTKSHIPICILWTFTFLFYFSYSQSGHSFFLYQSHVKILKRLLWVYTL